MARWTGWPCLLFHRQFSPASSRGSSFPMAQALHRFSHPKSASTRCRDCSWACLARWLTQTGNSSSNCGFEDSLRESRNSVQTDDSRERFQWSEVRRGIFNIQVWLSALAYFAILTGLYSFGLFVSLPDSCSIVTNSCALLT